MKKVETQNNNLPKGWRRVKLGEVAEIIRGVSFSKEERSLRWFKGGTPILRANNIKENGTLDLNDLMYVIDSKISDEQKLQIDDIVVVASSGNNQLVGKNARINKINQVLSFGAFMYCIRPKTIDPKYLYLFFRSSSYRNQLREIVDGTNINNLRKSDLANIEFLTPEDPNEQKRIAEILSAFDDKIELNNKIIKTLEEMAQEVFKEWILKNQKSKIKNQKLGNLADIRYGKEPSVNKLKKSGYSVYGANGIIGYSDYYDFSERQIIIGCRGVVGNVTLTLPNCVVTHNSLIIMPRNNKKIFFYYLLKNQNLDSVVGGSAQPQITIRDLEQLGLSIVEENLQNKFELMVGNIEQKKLLILFENQKLTAIRDLLLPKLMRGEIKL